MNRWKIFEENLPAIVSEVFRLAAEGKVPQGTVPLVLEKFKAPVLNAVRIAMELKGE